MRTLSHIAFSIRGYQDQAIIIAQVSLTDEPAIQIAGVYDGLVSDVRKVQAAFNGSYQLVVNNTTIIEAHSVGQMPATGAALVGRRPSACNEQFRQLNEQFRTEAAGRKLNALQRLEAPALVQLAALLLPCRPVTVARTEAAFKDLLKRHAWSLDFRYEDEVVVYLVSYAWHWLLANLPGCEQIVLAII